MSEYRKILSEFDSYEEYLENVNSSIDTNWWNEAKKNHSRSSYEHYLRFYPQGKYKDEAQKEVNTFNELEEKQRETKLWNQAIKNNNKSSYERYLNAYYNGIYANEAKLKIDEFIQLKKENDIKIDTKHWNIALNKNTTKSYSDYLIIQKYGNYRNEAYDAIERIEEEKKWKATLKINTIEGYKAYSSYGKFNFRKEAHEKLHELYKIEEDVREKNAWKYILSLNEQESYEGYIKNFPNGLFTKTAKIKINECIKIKNKEIKDWNKAIKENTQQSYENYLYSYPNSIHRQKAQMKINLLRKLKERRERRELLKCTKNEIIRLDDEVQTWTDIDTGLMWEVKSEINVNYVYTFEKNLTPKGFLITLEDDAKDIFSYAKQLNRRNYGGFNDWRVPSINELVSLIPLSFDGLLPSRGTRSIKRPLIKNNGHSAYWSKDTSSFLFFEEKAMTIVPFNDMSCIAEVKNEALHIRCVRGNKRILK